MARDPLFRFLTVIVRESARQQRLSAANRNLAIRNQARLVRDSSRVGRQLASKAKKEREALGVTTAEEMTTDLNERLELLADILPATLRFNDQIHFSSLRLPPEFPDFIPEPELAKAFSAAC